MSDAINPDHYKRLPAEAIEIIEAAIEGAPTSQEAYLQGQALKYLLRANHKNGREDIHKAKWYLDRMVASFTVPSDLLDHPSWTYEIDPAEQPKPTLNSDTIPAGYSKLNDSSEEPRQLGDLRWSVAAKRYVEISVDEIGYANRDNWAACRKVESVVKQSLTTEPPDGWRFLEIGEVIRKGDKYRDLKSQTWIEVVAAIGDSLQDFHKPTIRRNRFEVGEKVVRVSEPRGIVFHVKFTLDNNFYGLETEGGLLDRLSGNCLAPYIEDAK